ncbi:hypothetical protein PHMEG_0008261 [Phytophthora megakarya]|uniref:Uncharacterized protein n=1 Tax=Phytophthora megakarya TaxID=4795 RepID=A0A225WK11_9STRA|nr:hypothetical protein PHMEG_0008261 [Phytophthora megakarya]
MVAEGKTVEDLAEESCPCFGRIDKLFGGNSNVTPPSEMSGPYNDADWFPISDGWTANRNSSADKGEQDEVDAGSSQSDVASQIDEEHENIDPNIQPITQSRQTVSMVNPSTTTQNSTEKQKPSAKTKSQKSAAKTMATKAADAKGVGKAMNYKRKDFGSVYTEASKKRQAFNEQKFKRSFSRRNG